MEHGPYRVIADRPTTSKYERTLAENFVFARPSSGRVAYSLTTRATSSHGDSAFTLEIFA